MGVAGVASGTAAAASNGDRLRSADEFDIGLSVSKMASSEAATAVDRLLDARSITSIQSFLESHGLRLNTDDVTGKQVSTEQGSFKSYDVSVVGTDGDVTVFDQEETTWGRVSLPSDITSADTNTPERVDDLFVSDPGVIRNFEEDVVTSLEWQKFARARNRTPVSAQRDCNTVDTDVLCAILSVLLLAAGVALTVLSAGTATVVATFAVDAVITVKCAINQLLEEYNVYGDADWKFCLDGTCWESFGAWDCTPYPTDLTIKPICP